jgi:glycosyltransferase involved in cell wall biosynthesis
LRIAIVVNSFPETSETFIINKVIALANAGHSIKVIRLNHSGNSALKVLYKFHENRNIQIIDPNIPSSIPKFFASAVLSPAIFWKAFAFSKRKFTYKYKRKVFLNLFNKNGFDIVHFEFSGIAINFIDILKYISPKTVVSCRGSAEKVKILSEPHRAENLQKMFSKIHAVHCVSTDMEQTIAPYCKNMSKVFVNRPAIDPFFFSPNKRPHDFKGTLILSVGRFTFQKGYIFGLMAIKALVDKGHAVKWCIIGDGPQHEEMLFHIHTLGIAEHVSLLGKRNKDEVNGWYSQTDIFLLTSVYEGIPNVVLEAMAMELPVVATRSGGVDEVIEHGKDGFIAEVYNVDTIVQHLEQLIVDKPFANQMGFAARKKILDHFTIERQVKVFEQQYRAL